MGKTLAIHQNIITNRLARPVGRKSGEAIGGTAVRSRHRSGRLPRPYDAYLVGQRHVFGWPTARIWLADDACSVVGARRLGKTLAIHQNIITNRLARSVGQ